MRYSSRIVIGAFLLLSGFSGCLDVETTTTVNRDGSLTRTVTFVGDSGTVYRGNYPLTIDSSWKSSIRQIDAKKWEFSATKTFPDVRRLNEATAAIPNKTLPVSIALEQDFLWFVTDYRYRETYGRWAPFDNVPLTDFVSQAELELARKHEVDDEPYNTRGDSLALADAGDRFEKWDARNIFESWFGTYLEGVKRTGDALLNPESVIGKKEELFEASRQPIGQDKFDTLSVIFGKVLKTRLWPKILGANKEAFDRLKARLDFRAAISANTYKVNIAMPGIITETNARSIEGNTVKFSDFMQLAYTGDYEMWVTSRTINWWAIIVTAVLIIGGAVAMVVSRKRKGKG